MKRFLFFFLTMTTTLFPTVVVQDQTELPVLAPSFQKSRTQKLILDNGLKVYLISDPNAEKSAAALSVNAGSWDDPLDHPGLAHFLEHMVFMGTEKYPDEADFSNYIKQHGGKTNAFTEDQYTTYLFEINTGGLKGALERFSEFFKSPLIKPTSMEREIRAVEQEFSSHSQRDESRRIMVYKELGHPDHPFSRFNFGNRQSLEKTTSKDIKEWFKKNYSANQMSLVIYSPLGLDRLRLWAEKYFATIPNLERKSVDYQAPLFSDKLLGKVLYVESQKDETSMMMVWELPKEFAKMIETRPDELACHVLGHEGEESLLAELQREGLATELGCGGARWGNDAMAFIIEITLTRKGMEQPFNIALQVYRAIARMQHEEYPRYLFDEYQMIGKIKRQYPIRKNPFDEVKTHSRNLRFESLATYPEVTTVIQSYDPRQIRKLAESLTPENMVLDITAKPELTGVKPDRKETWMKTPYAIREVPPNILKEWKNASIDPKIEWPGPNVLIPQNLTLIPRNGEQPTRIQDDEYGTVYWIPDHLYNVPKVSWTIRILSPHFDAGDPKSIVMTDLMIKAVKNDLNPFTYLAKLAELDYAIKPVSGGIEIAINGFSENAFLFLSEILSSLFKPSINEESFRLNQKTLESQYGNIHVEEPYLQAIDLFKKILYERYSTEMEKEKAIASLTYVDLQNFLDSLFKESRIEAVLYGNTTRTEAQDVSNYMRAFQDTPYLNPSRQKVAILPKAPYFLSQPAHVRGNAVVVVLEDPNYSLKSYAAQEILSTMISSPFFDELRTKQQTAYLIANLHEEVEKRFYTIFLLESFTYAPSDLLARIELFLETAPDHLTKQTFETVKAALLKQLRTPPESMKKQGQTLARLAFEEGGDFNWKEKAAEATQALTFDEFIAYTRQFLGKENRRRLAIFIKGRSSDDMFEYKEAESVTDLKDAVEYRSAG